ncbi:unnamed protein product [Calypogeia fissa]
MVMREMALEASLKSSERRMREEFQLEDEGRITQLLFLKIHERWKRRERHAEGGRTRPEKEKVEVKKEVGESSSADDLGKIAEGLKILTSHVMEERKKDVPRREGGERRDLSCMWCDSKEHSKRDYQDLREALDGQHVKYVGELGKRRLAHFDTGEEIHVNFGRGGMKALVDRRRELGKVRVGMAGYRPFTLVSEREERERDMREEGLCEEIAGRRYAEFVRRQSGWDVPVLIAKTNGGSEETWRVSAETKKGEQEGKKIVKEVEAVDPAKPSTSTAPKNEKEGHKGAGKRPGYVLGREIEWAVDFAEVRKKFWRQEVRGLSNLEVVGCMCKEAQDALFSQLRRKRVPKDGPAGMTGALIREESEDEEEEEFLTRVRLGEAEEVGHVEDEWGGFSVVQVQAGMILGQPFIIELRLETKVLDDGSQVAKIRSKDGSKIIQFMTVGATHAQDRMRLSLEPEGVEEGKEKGFY